MSADNFKCLIFAQGLVSAKNSEIRQRVLSKLESEPGLALQKLAEDCQCVVSVKNDSKNIEVSGVVYVRRTNYKPKNYTPGKSSENKKYVQTLTKNRHPIQKLKLPTSPCSRCGRQYWSTNCFYKNKTCKECGKIGHKATCCRNKGNKNRVRQARSNIKTEKNRRKYVTVNILDKKVDLQIDSSSNLSIINLHTWKKLKKNNDKENKQNSPCSNR